MIELGSNGTRFKNQNLQKLFDVEFSDKPLCTTNITSRHEALLDRQEQFSRLTFQNKMMFLLL